MSSRYLRLTLASLALVLLGGAVSYFVLRSRQQTQLVLHARKALEAQKPEEAAALLRAALARTPNDGQARYLLARAYQLQGDLEAALAEFRRVPLDNSKAELVLVQLAGIQLALNRAGEAERTLRDCLTRFPKSVAARQYLLDILAFQLRDREMFGLLDELWEIASTRPILDRVWVLAKSLNLRFVRPQQEEIWPRLQAFARQEPDNLHTQVAQGKFRLELNTDVVDATRILQKCLVQDPDNLDAIAALASHYVEHGGAENNEIDELLIQWSSGGVDAKYWQVLGDWQVQQRQIGDAMSSYRRAQSLDPTEWRTLHKMGLLMIRMAKQSGDLDHPHSADGQQLIEEAATLKERRVQAGEHFQYLQSWLTGSTNTPPELKVPQIVRMVEIAAFCESVHCETEALRWCEVIQTVAPGEATTRAIHERLTGQLKAQSSHD